MQMFKSIINMMNSVIDQTNKNFIKPIYFLQFWYKRKISLTSNRCASVKKDWLSVKKDYLFASYNPKSES